MVHDDRLRCLTSTSLSKMGDKDEEKPKEKKLFNIPTAKDIARLEHGKSKVKSYFKSQFGNPPSSALSESEGNLSKPTQSNVARNDTSDVKRISGGPCSGTSLIENSSYRTNVHNKDTIPVVIGRDCNMVTSSVHGGTEPTACTSAKPDEGAAGSKRKIGSAFADKFSALREGPDYEEPIVKRQTVPTAIISAPIAAGSKGPAGVKTIIVNTRQRGNPILKHIRNVPWEFGDIVPDYVMGRTVCALFLSLRYHHLNPNYIHDRFKDLGHQYELRVLLVQVDVKDPHYSVKELARMALLADCTLILAWSAEEAGRYLETFKSYENKSADALKERVETDYLSKVTDVLGTVRSVNRTDAVTLVSTFGTFDKMIAASKEDLYLCPGFGPQKAQRLYDVLHEPFLKGAKEPQESTASS